MTVEELRKEIDDLISRYGEEALQWDVYTEQCSEDDKIYKRGQQRWDIVTNGEGWEYFKSVGYCGTWEEKKIFTVDVNF